MNVRLLIIKPIDRWLSEEKAEEGYWGFVRCREDYEKEKTNIHRQIEDLIANLRGEGIEVDLLPTIEIENVDDLLERTEDLRKADVNIVLTLFPAGWISAGDLSYGIVAASNYVVFYDRFRPNIYAGTLFNPPMYKRLEKNKLSDKIFLVEGDPEKLKAILRAVYALRRISSAKLVCVGPMNSAFGGWLSFKKGSEIFGYKTRFYTYSKFVEDFNEFLKDKDRRVEAERVIGEFTSGAVEVVEPTAEKLLRAGIYYMVLKKYVEENEADWITVNCLSELIEKTKATPCFAFSKLNDDGIVATCEADPTAMILHYLMRHISGKPAFFNDPTVNEKDGTLILAHCTSPTKLLGFNESALPYQVRTHHESNYGATPKVFFKEGEVTIAGLSFDMDEMLIVKGRIVGSPNLRICRSQVEVKVANPSGVLREWRGFHWVLVYGDYIEELRAICKVKGIKAIIYE